jgi:hypothetical protein
MRSPVSSLPPDFVAAIKCYSPETIYYAINNNYDLSILCLNTEEIWKHPQAIEDYVIAGGVLTTENFAHIALFSKKHFQRLCQLFPPDLFDDFHKIEKTIQYDLMHLPMQTFCDMLTLLAVSIRSCEDKLEMIDFMINYFPNAKINSGGISILNSRVVSCYKDDAPKILEMLCGRKILDANDIIKFAIKAELYNGFHHSKVFSMDATFELCEKFVLDGIDILDSVLATALIYGHNKLSDYLFDSGLKIEKCSSESMAVICSVKCDTVVLDRLLNVGFNFGLCFENMIYYFRYYEHAKDRILFNEKIKWFIDNLPGIDVVNLWKSYIKNYQYALDDSLMDIFDFEKCLENKN